MTPAELQQLLSQVKRIAVVGASPNPVRPSHWISRFLLQQGYDVIPVNPGHTELLGRPCYGDVKDIPEPLEVVNIFRRSDQVLPIIESALTHSRLKLIWMQDGVYNESAAALAEAAGIPVVMNDCIYRFLSRH